MTGQWSITEFKERVSALCGGEKVFCKSALRIRDGAGVLEQVLGSGRYRTVLEIGTYRGITAAYMAGFCERVITIDLLQGKMEVNRESFDRVAFWRDMGIADRIDLHLVADDAQKAALVKDLDFNIAFIDGAHDRAVRDDFAITRKCGRVLFHDADDNGPSQPNCVHEFIRTLPEDEVEFMDIFALWTARPA